MKHFLYDTMQTLHQVAQFFLPALLIFYTFIQPIQLILLAVGAFITLDTVIAFVRVRYQKKKWTSRKMRMGLVPKMLCYQLVVLTFYILDVALLNEFIHLFTQIEFLLTKVAGIVFCYVEFISINEHVKAIKGKSLTDYVLDLVKNAKKAKKTFEEINEDKEDKKPQS